MGGGEEFEGIFIDPRIRITIKDDRFVQVLITSTDCLDDATQVEKAWGREVSNWGARIETSHESGEGEGGEEDEHSLR